MPSLSYKIWYSIYVGRQNLILKCCIFCEKLLVSLFNWNQLIELPFASYMLSLSRYFDASKEFLINFIFFLTGWLCKDYYIGILIWPQNWCVLWEVWISTAEIKIRNLLQVEYMRSLGLIKGGSADTAIICR